MTPKGHFEINWPLESWQGIQTFNSIENSNTDAGSRRLPPFSLAPLHLPSAQRCRTPICKETMTNSFEMIFDRPAIKSFYVLRFFQKINLTSCTVWTTNVVTFWSFLKCFSVLQLNDTELRSVNRQWPNSFEMIIDRPAIKSFYVLQFQKINLTSCTFWTINFVIFGSKCWYAKR